MADDEPAPTDRDLLAQSAQGDADAFAVFVHRHRAAVYRYLRAAGPNDADAEDALQQTFLQAWRGAGGTDVRNARAWLCTIARHALLRQRRRPSAAPAAMESLDALGAAAGFADPVATPERLAGALEERAALSEALDGLPAQDREVLMLREIEQLSGEETAAVLGLSLDAMKSRLHRARLRLVAEVRRRLVPGGAA